MRLLSCLLIFVSLFHLNAQAADYTAIVDTPRGSKIHLDFYNFGTVDQVLLVAPGGACDPRLDLYDEMGRASKSKQTLVVRMHWSYCVADPEKGRPSETLQDEDEDLRTALSFLIKWLNLDEKDIVLGGKSLGSIVGQRVFQKNQNLKGFLLMTPICTRNGKNVFADYYIGLDQETRPVAVIKGDADPLCDTLHWIEYLADRAPNFKSTLVQGDHGFRLFDSEGKLDEELTRQNIAMVSDWISNFGH